MDIRNTYIYLYSIYSQVRLNLLKIVGHNKLEHISIVN